MHLRKIAGVALLVCLPVLAGCGGGKSAAEKVTEAAAKAKAACHLFTTLKTPSGTDDKAKVEYATVSAEAFRKSADLATAAKDLDPRWTSLHGAASRLSDDFALIVRGATTGLTTSTEQREVLAAVDDARNARPLFIRECTKADPGSFTASPTPSPTSTKHAATKES